METKAYTTTDKSTWPRGPWDNEPDKVQWQDEATGLPCLIVRAYTGSLCGYVGLAPSHPWHAKRFDEPEVIVDVHGGLTFSDHCGHGDDEEHGICHVPAAGEPDHVWWFGFDTGHCWDISPATQEHFPAYRDSEYRDLAYVRGEVTQLAAQLAAVHA